MNSEEHSEGREGNTHLYTKKKLIDLLIDVRLVVTIVSILVHKCRGGAGVGLREGSLGKGYLVSEMPR